tara:strand:- start:801 stop:1007 length:207 start_codon:yes stop_codon:yes gene_type:complete
MWEKILKHDATEINKKNILEYIKKDTDNARVVEMLYNNWKKDNFSTKSRGYDSLRLFIKGLKDLEWEL